MPEAERILPDARHETTDIGPGFIWGAVALCLATLLACALMVLWLYPHSTLERTLPLALPLYPQPRLQPDPAEDMQSFYLKELQVLNSIGWVDKKAGLVHIPIAQAMQEVAEEGIAGWPATSEAPP